MTRHVQTSAGSAEATSAQAPSATKTQPRSRSLAPAKTVLNFWLDCFLLVVFLSLVWVTAVLRLLFPVGTGAEECSLWGGTVEQWRDVQFVVLCVLSLSVLLHVMLHWSWVCGVVARLRRRGPAARDDGSQTLVGVAVLLVVLHAIALGLLFAWYCIEYRVP